MVRCFRASPAGFVLAAVLLAGCSHVPLTSLMTLRRIDPLTTDPTHLFAAVRHPVALRARPGDVRLTLAVERRGGVDRRTLDIALETVPTAAPGVPRAPEAGPGQVVDIFRVPPADASRLAAFREQILEDKRRDPDGIRGSLTVAASACRDTTVPLPTRLVIDTFLSADGAPDFVPVVVGYDLASGTSGEGGAPEPCPAP